jgi:hypothetical protein
MNKFNTRLRGVWHGVKHAIHDRRVDVAGADAIDSNA